MNESQATYQVRCQCIRFYGNVAKRDGQENNRPLAAGGLTGVKWSSDFARWFAIGYLRQFKFVLEI